MLRLKNLHTTQHYAKILDKKVGQDMQALKKTQKTLTVITKTGTWVPVMLAYWMGRVSISCLRLADRKQMVDERAVR